MRTLAVDITSWCLSITEFLFKKDIYCVPSISAKKT